MTSTGGTTRKRRPLMIDSELADTIKDIAARHGMTISAYMRALLTGAIEAETNNLFAPIVLRKALIYSKLHRAGVTFLPISLLDSCNNSSLSEQARLEGKKLGALLKSLGVGLEEALDIILEDSRIAIRERDKIVILPSTRPSEEAVKNIVEGIAESYGAEVTKEDAGITIVKLKR
ncbi:hypothetical protein Pyrde_1724 [Pyrodictium delaneyi]|uniref:Ribbon-helix-helix protein CopG domain-containing protein n=2 Tax=Pyrodictium delaneyi TaxID=1273541 RepID=A0A0P0N4Y2_9CREN|nr:hypothetical protein [Pyrodictium delaneyi]ALL01767.1 hypothetical protein Pyrde_1724 [Pyrodictium delaneyi]